MILSVLFFCATVGLIFSMNEIDKFTEEKTTEFVATVTDIRISNTGKDVFVELYTKEYEPSLFISKNVCSNMQNDYLKGIKEGDTIFFRIEKIKTKQMDDVDFIDIVSLRTEKNSILTLEEYNKIIHQLAFPARVASFITALLFCFLFLYAFYKFKHQK